MLINVAVDCRGPTFLQISKGQKSETTMTH